MKFLRLLLSAAVIESAGIAAVIWMVGEPWNSGQVSNSRSEAGPRVASSSFPGIGIRVDANTSARTSPRDPGEDVLRKLESASLVFRSKAVDMIERALFE